MSGNKMNETPQTSNDPDTENSHGQTGQQMLEEEQPIQSRLDEFLEAWRGATKEERAA